MVKETASQKRKRDTERAKWETEIVNTDVLVYFSRDNKGEPMIEEVVAPTKGLYSDLQDTIQENTIDADLCECDKFELNTTIRAWLEDNYPDWQEFVDPEFYCYICEELKNCHGDWLEAGEDVKEKIQETYPPSGEGQGGTAGAGGKVEEEEAKEDGPSRIVLE